MSPLAKLLTILTLSGLITGCSDHEGRQRVRGSISLDSRPLASGSVSFQPTAGGTGPGAGASIVEGRFDIPAAKGLWPGDYAVTIVTFRSTGRQIKDPQRGLVDQMQRVSFHERVPLEATVSASTENEFHFSLTTAETR